MKKYLFGFAIIAGFCFYFFNSNSKVIEKTAQYAQEQDYKENQPKVAQDVVQNKIDEEPYFPQDRIKDTFTSKQSKIDRSKLKFKIKKKYNRQITNADIQDLLQFKTSTKYFFDNIDLLAKDLKNTDYTNEAVIDLSTLPESNDEKDQWFNGFSTVIQQKLFAEIVKDKKDYKKITNHLLAVQVVDFLSPMKFGGYSKSGSFVYEISDDLLAAKPTKSKKRQVASSKKAGLFNFSTLKDDTTPEAEEALMKLKSEQTLYGDDLSGNQGRDSIAVEDDPRTTKFYQLLESELFSKLGNFGVAVTTSDYHQKNMSLLSKLPEMAQKNPAAFGLKRGESTSINITNVGYNQLLHMIIHNKSLWSAGISGALSAIIDGDILKLIFTKAPIIFAKFKLILTVGVEPVIMSFLIYQGMKQGYVLHRFYSYMMGAKQANAINNPGEDFPYYKVVSSFDPTKVYFDEYFRRETIKALTQSYLTGVFIRNVVTIPFAKSLTNKIAGVNFVQKLLISSKSIANSSLTYASNKVASNSVAGKHLQKKLIERQSIKNPDKYLQALIKGVNTEVKGNKPNSDSDKDDDDDKKKKSSMSPKKIASKLGKIAAFGPAKLIDFIITAPVIYIATYRILSSATLSMTETDLSPSASIQRSLFSGIDGAPSFAHGTRNVLYPLCRYLSHYNKIEIETVNNLNSRQKRQKACLKLIKSIEGYNNAEDMIDDLNNKMPNSNIDFNNLYQAFTTKDVAPMRRAELDDILEDSYNYPIEYRITWLSALRSIFGLIHIPRSYREIQHNLILKKVRPWAWWDLGPSGQVYRTANVEIAAYRNIYRLNYAIELLAVDTYRYKHKTNRSTMSRTDSRIAKETNDLVDAWIDYVTFQKEKVVEINKLINSDLQTNEFTPQNPAQKIFSWVKRKAGEINEVRKGILSGGDRWNSITVIENEISAVRKKPVQ